MEEKLLYDLKITLGSDKRFPTGFDHRVLTKQHKAIRVALTLN